MSDGARSDAVTRYYVHVTREIEPMRIACESLLGVFFFFFFFFQPATRFKVSSSVCIRTDLAEGAGLS